MKVSLQSKNLWVETDVQNVAFCPQVNLVSGDGVSIFLPQALLAASSDFMKSLLQHSCSTCGGVTRVSLPCVSGDTLTLASQILLSGESEHMDADEIVNNFENVEKLLELLGCRAQLRTVCSRTSRDLQNDCKEGLADIDDGGRVRFLSRFENEKGDGDAIDKINQEKIVREVDLHDRRGQEPFTEIKDINQNYEKLVHDTRLMKEGGSTVVVDPGTVSDVADPTQDDPRTALEYSGIQIHNKSGSGGRGLKSHGRKAVKTAKRIISSSSSSSASPRLRSLRLKSQMRKARQKNLEIVRKDTANVNTVKQKKNVKEKKTSPVLSKSSEYFPCPDCDETFRYMVSLRKHQVDEHIYEELEDMFVGEFVECSVCCKIDFSNTGLGMFIRHKAESHGAVEMFQKMARATLEND